MKGKLDKVVMVLALNKMLNLDIDKEMQAVIRKYGSGDVELAIARNGVSSMLLQKFYEITEMDALNREKERY